MQLLGRPLECQCEPMRGFWVRARVLFQAAVDLFLPSRQRAPRQVVGAFTARQAPSQAPAVGVASLPL
jgi:hypothetical protein